MNTIGIERIGVYPGSLVLELADLARVRGIEPGYLDQSIMVRERSLAALCEDVVTLAVNSARPIFEYVDRECIGLLIVATESGLDQEKAVSTWVHRHLALPSTCRVVELKAACHAGAAALKMAESWIASGLNRGQKALLINVDISNNMVRCGKMEYSLGAGGVALLVSDEPHLAIIETGKSAIHTCEVTDVIRPLPWKEIALDVEASLYAYLTGLETTFEAYVAGLPEPSVNQGIDYNIYHLPFPGISKKAHQLVLEMQGVVGKEAQTASFQRKVAPSLFYSQRMGATYCGSIFLCLLSLMRTTSDISAGQRVGIYSYGSGSCAEFFSMLVGEKAVTIATQQGQMLDALLDRRTRVSVEAYELLEHKRGLVLQGADYAVDEADLGHLCAKPTERCERLILERIESHVRSYRYV